MEKNTLESALKEFSQTSGTNANDVKEFFALMSDGSIKRMPKEDMATVLGGLLNISSQGKITVNKKLSPNRWYRIVQTTVSPNDASSLLLNMSNPYDTDMQRHLLIYATLNGYGENVVNKLASTTIKLITKIRIVKKSSTDVNTKNYLDVYLSSNNGNNRLYYSASNMIGVELLTPVDVTEQPLPNGYTSVEFDV